MKSTQINQDYVKIYLQSECIEKCQVEMGTKYDREDGFDVILGCVASIQTMFPDKLKHKVKQQFLSCDNIFMLHWRLRYTMTGKQVDAAIDAFLVS